MAWLPGLLRLFDEQTTAPTVNEDMNDGFEIGDVWLDETADKGYVCLDNTVGAAVWIEFTGAGVIDHGGLDGLADDDHTQYSLADGSRAFTGVVEGVSPTASAHLATKGYIDDAITEVIYNVSSASLEVGDDDAGDYTNLEDHDAVVWQIGEVTGVPGFDVRLNFSGVATFNRVRLVLYYVGSASHNVSIQVYDYEDVDWETYYSFVGQSGYNFIEFTVPDPADHIDSGAVVVRIVHTDSGNAAHTLYLDYCVLAKAGIGSSGTHSELIGLEEDDHPQYHTDARGDARYISIVGGATEDNLATFDASGEVQDSGSAVADFAVSGHNHDSAYISVVGGATEDNFASFDASGEVQDSGYAATDFAADDHDHNPASACAVLVTLGSNQTNMAIDSEVTINFDTEIFDAGSNFNTTTFTFTAPKTGKYAINALIRLEAVDTAATYYNVYVVTSNRTYYHTLDPNFNADANFFTAAISALADMDENDTASVIIYQSGGTQQTDLVAARSYLSIWAQDTPMFETDHGGLAGLSDDDHTQYLLADGSRDVTANLQIDRVGQAQTAVLQIIADEDKDSAGQFQDENGYYWRFGRRQNTQTFDISYWNGSTYIEGFSLQTDGSVLNTKQPAFQAKLSSAQSNIATGSWVTAQYDTEFFDQGSDFNTGTYTFTAPVTGKYLLTAIVRIDQIDTAASIIGVQIVTSNRNYRRFIDPNFSADLDYFGVTIAVVADMDASDTAYVQVEQISGTAQLDIREDDSTFSGVLIC